MVKEAKVYEENYTIPEVWWDSECIEDWGERIANYSDEQKAMYNDMVPKIIEF